MHSARTGILIATEDPDELDLVTSCLESVFAQVQATPGGRYKACEGATQLHCLVLAVSGPIQPARRH